MIRETSPDPTTYMGSVLGGMFGFIFLYLNGAVEQHVSGCKMGGCTNSSRAWDTRTLESTVFVLQYQVHENPQFKLVVRL